MMQQPLPVIMQSSLVMAHRPVSVGLPTSHRRKGDGQPSRPCASHPYQSAGAPTKGDVQWRESQPARTVDLVAYNAVVSGNLELLKVGRVGSVSLSSRPC
jgi:hypothetical protein